MDEKPFGGGNWRDNLVPEKYDDKEEAISHNHPTEPLDNHDATRSVSRGQAKGKKDSLMLRWALLISISLLFWYAIFYVIWDKLFKGSSEYTLSDEEVKKARIADIKRTSRINCKILMTNWKRLPVDDSLVEYYCAERSDVEIFPIYKK